MLTTGNNQSTEPEVFFVQCTYKIFNVPFTSKKVPIILSFSISWKIASILYSKSFI